MTVDLQSDAVGMLAGLAAGSVTATEILTATVAAVRERNAELVALTDWNPDVALAEAAAVDRARDRGDVVGPLAGVTVSIKDTISAAGLRTTHGRLSDAREGLPDSPATRRLRAAGAIVIGKSNVPTFLNGYHSTNADFGVTRNPWDLTRSPGGSSGGSGAAVAAGFATADLGSDLAGSLRVPASWCGLFGHKPSNGIVSKAAQMPWPAEGLLEPAISAVGPFARSARDLELFMDVLVGVEGPNALGWRIELPAARVRGLRGLRVGVWLDDEIALVDSETRSAISRFADALERDGSEVEAFVRPPGASASDLDLFTRLHATEVVHGFDDEMWRRVLDAAAGDGAFAPRAQMMTQSFRDGIEALERHETETARWAREVFGRFDVLICPATPAAAQKLVDDTYDSQLIDIDGVEVPADAALSAWNMLTCLPKLPTTVVPLGPGETSGLPVGAQIVGPYLEDRTSLAVAVAAEAAGIISYRPPPIPALVSKDHS